MGCNCNKTTRPQPATKPVASPRAYNVVDAVVDTVTGDAQFAGEEKQTERKNICFGCDKYRKLLNQCSVCGCIVFFKVKFTQSVCPEGKW